MTCSEPVFRHLMLFCDNHLALNRLLPVGCLTHGVKNSVMLRYSIFLKQKQMYHTDMKIYDKKIQRSREFSQINFSNFKSGILIRMNTSKRYLIIMNSLSPKLFLDSVLICVSWHLQNATKALSENASSRWK